jgi:hypothetical protein
MTHGVMTEGGPKFSDEESALILHRAAELQAKEGRGLSLRELEAAAAEAGIDVALVRRAAEEVAVTGPPPPPPAPISGGALGAPLRLVHERTVPGEAGGGAWEDEVDEIRRQLGVRGTVEATGRQLVWTSAQKRKLRVTIASRGGRRIVRVEEQLGDLGGGLFLGLGLPVACAGLGFILPICIAVLDAPVLIPIALMVWFGMAFMLARGIFKSVVRQRDPQLHALAEGLAEVTRQTARELPPGREG